MSEIIFFILGACVSGAVLLVSGVELILSIRRRKNIEALTQQITDLKSQYSEHLTQLSGREAALLAEKESAIAEIQSGITEETKLLEEKYKAELAEAHQKNKAALEKAKGKVKDIEDHAKEEAKEYMEKRKEEVEEELVDLVIDVSRRVLPKGITYDVQKELVMEALRDATTTTKK